ncbi:MAG: RloB domain-containing protein, partial [Candidatus Aenigmarchaeota archaeon]|nr:RloB domain-containing protein [Candidatus Aenigmarchaeota archaeon]
ALSNPCFELWFLLHYKLILSQISRDEALIELKKYIKNYKKNMDVYPILKDKQGDAIQNAKKLNKKHKDQNIDLFNRRSNPATQVFELIEFIQKLIENNKRS